MFAIKSLILAAIGAASFSVAAPVAAGQSIKMAETTNVGPTDITASNPWWDLCLLYNKGDPDGFNAFSRCVRGDRRYDCFQYICSKPYQSDLYSYFYFDNDNTFDFAYSDAESDKYTVLASVARKEGSAVAWSNRANYSMKKIGTSYNVGTRFIIKYKIEGIFKDATASSTFDFALDSIWASGTSLFDISSEQTFTYTDDQYDMTTQLWGTKSKVVTMTKEEARPMTVREVSSDPWVIGIAPGGLMSVSSDYYEDHFVFYDLDRYDEINQLLSIDFYYTMVTYYVYDLKWYDQPNTSLDGNHSNGGVYYLDVPLNINYEAGGTQEAQCASKGYPTEFEQKKSHSYYYNDDGTKHTVDNVEVNKTWSVPFQHTYTYTRHIPQIIDNSTLDSSVQDVNTRSWLQNNAKKSDGSMYQFSTCFDITKREWVGPETKVEPDWWHKFWGESTNYFSVARCHTAQGIIASKMTLVNQEGEQLEWNIFSQSVNEQADVPSAPHSPTDATAAINEMLIAFNKQNKGWLVTLAVIGYYVVCSAIAIAIVILVAGSGSQTVTVKSSGQPSGGEPYRGGYEQYKATKADGPSDGKAEKPKGKAPKPDSGSRRGR